MPCLKQNPKWLVTFRKRKIQRKEEAWGQLAFCLFCHMCWYQLRWHYFPFLSGNLHPTLMANICKRKCRTHTSVVFSCLGFFWSLQASRCEAGLWAEAHAVCNGETAVPCTFPAADPNGSHRLVSSQQHEKPGKQLLRGHLFAVISTNKLPWSWVMKGKWRGFLLMQLGQSLYCWCK